MFQSIKNPRFRVQSPFAQQVRGKLIEALQKKEIRQIPKLPAGNVIIDGNKLLQQLGVIQYYQNQQQPANDGRP